MDGGAEGLALHERPASAAAKVTRTLGASQPMGGARIHSAHLTTASPRSSCPTIGDPTKATSAAPIAVRARPTRRLSSELPMRWGLISSQSRARDARRKAQNGVPKLQQRLQQRRQILAKAPEPP